MIELKGITKSFSTPKDSVSDNRVLAGIDLIIETGEFFCLLGPSGCGKTTLLRMIAGLEKPDVGTVHVGGRNITDMPPHKRGCAMVFQNYALWPHLTVGENIVYGLAVQKKNRLDIQRSLEKSLTNYQLQGLAGRYPHQLSGGQQQRVALARAMALDPMALLMDEPLSNLDAALRKTIRRDLLEFHRRTGSTVLYVTHDQEEALALADRMAVMQEGKILELGKPRDLYTHPQKLETAQFLGDMNIFRGKERAAVMAGHAHGVQENQGSSASSILCIRPENVHVHTLGAMPTQDGGVKGDLTFIEFMGSHATLGFSTAAGRVLARATILETETLSIGQACFLEFPSEHCLWY
jgi:ABC-type Fe3+/spermidine/putrescine transport system ATPase subunit